MRYRPHTHPTLFFAVLSVMLSITFALFADIATRVFINGDAILQVFDQHIHDVITGVGGTLYLTVPYLIIAWMSGRLAQHTCFKMGCCFFLGANCALIALTFYCYMGAASAIHQKAWTAAALSIGMSPILSIPLLAIALGMQKVLIRKYK